jgi:hypothetical protein
MKVVNDQEYLAGTYREVVHYVPATHVNAVTAATSIGWFNHRGPRSFIPEIVGVELE